MATILHSTNTWLPMSQTWILNQMKFLERYTPVVMAKRTANLDHFGDQEVYALHERSWLNYAWQKVGRSITGSYPFSRRLASAPEVVLLHSHSGTSGRVDQRLAVTSGLPHVVSLYGADIWQESRDEACLRGYRSLFDSVSILLAEGDAMREKTCSMGCSPEKVIVHHLGILPDVIQFKPRRPDAGGPIKILMAGRAIEKKGHIDGLRAFASLADGDSGLQLRIMTWGDYQESVDIIAALESIVESENLGDRVTISGLLTYSEYVEMIANYHVFLNPSRHAADGDAEGGFPVILTEVMASGMPIVATDHCDAPELVRDGETGLIAEENNVPMLTEKLADMLNDTGRWGSFTKNGRALVEAEYNAVVQTTRLEAIYDRVIHGV